MVNLLKSTINSIIENDIVMTHDADYILKQLERQGMMPPSSYPFIFIEHNNKGISLDEFSRYTKSFTWEPENEK